MPEDFGSLKGGGDCQDHYHNSDRYPTRDSLLWLQSLEHVKTITADYVVDPKDDIVVINGSSLVVTLPSAQNGRHCIFVVSSGSATLTPYGSETINGASSYTLDSKADVGYLKAVSGGWVNLVPDTSALAALAGSTSQSFSMLNGTVAGNITFTGTGNRITGDFSTLSLANRVMFQTSTVNGNTKLDLIPNGTAQISGFSAANNSDPTNASIGEIRATSTDVQIYSRANGTGTSLPMVFTVGSLEGMRIDTAGAVTIPGTLSLTGASSTLGYGTGAGGTVTQATSKSTAVTLNKPCGQITMNNAALAASTSISFTLVNSLIGTSDSVVVSIKDAVSSNITYQLTVSAVGSSLCIFHLRNVSAGSLSEAIVINFAIIKGATS